METPHRDEGPFEAAGKMEAPHFMYEEEPQEVLYVLMVFCAAKIRSPASHQIIETVKKGIEEIGFILWGKIFPCISKASFYCNALQKKFFFCARKRYRTQKVTIVFLFQ